MKRKMKLLLPGILICVLWLPAGASYAQDGGSLTGHITLIGGEINTGLLFQMDTGVPTNCNGAAFNLLKIPEAAKTAIAIALIAKDKGFTVTIFNASLEHGQGSFCIARTIFVNWP